jgi:hypothetical protein
MKTRKQKGGTIKNLDVRQILLTKPIENELRKENINLSRFSLQKGHQGFPLSRINTMKKINYNTLIQRNPITVKKTKYGKNINGEQKQLYELIDGRHRLTRAITLGKKTIKVIIQ